MYDDIFIKNLPCIDLHGETRSTSHVLVKDFILENIVLGNKKFVIIHGRGTGKLKMEVHNLLKQDKRVLTYYIYPYNVGCTIVILK